MTTDQKISKARREMERSIENSDWALNHYEFSINSYTTLPQHYLGLGGSLFAEGKTKRGRREFATSALYGRQLVRVYHNRWGEIDRSYYHAAGADLGRAVYAAFLSGDPRLLTALHDDITRLNEHVDLAHWDSVTRYLEIDLLLLLYRGDDDAASERIERLREEIDPDVAYDTLRQRIHEALVERDTAAAEAALQEFADSYRDILDKPTSYWRLLISHEAATYHLLAQHLGLDISIDSDEIPAAVESYDLGDEIELPDPEHVDADLIPDG